MKVLSKFLIIFCAATMLIFSVGCGSNSNGSTNSTNSAPVPLNKLTFQLAPNEHDVPVGTQADWWEYTCTNCGGKYSEGAYNRTPEIPANIANDKCPRGNRHNFIWTHFKQWMLYENGGQKVWEKFAEDYQDLTF